ncbi:MAG: prepilin-type N-terminal cleavage/methylation domain-containing protein [Planctomycetota bacterium]|jgi:prepilin-type N-terminal cleavage/methylation domain-containing protein/prepilin-type processing-associated H-X9-DG protein
MYSIKRKDHGFTLIELLVVIAIIALLMGILMPVLSAARKHAWGVTCQSNLRSIGFAANLFAQDHDFKVPRAGDIKILNPQAESSRWHNAFLKYLEHKPEDGDYRSVKVYRCPAYPDKRQTVCFVINGFQRKGAELMEYFKLTRIDNLRDRASTIYLADNEDGNWREIILEEDGPGAKACDVFMPEHLPGYYVRQAHLEGGSWSRIRDIDYTGSRVAHARHQQGHNALFFDWHIGYIKAEDSYVDFWRPKTH